MKNFMTLSKAECLEVSEQLQENAKGKYKDALLLADNGSYGSAIFNMILSMEEQMKAIIIFFDGNGFRFRQKVKGIKKLFTDHQLRYLLGFFLSVIDLVAPDLERKLDEFRTNPEKFLSVNPKDPAFQEMMRLWVVDKIKALAAKAEWFSSIKNIREEGIYVDVKGSFSSPMDKSKEEFEQVKKQVDGLRKIIDSLIVGELLPEDPLWGSIQGIKKQFIEEGWYEKLSKEVKKISTDDQYLPFKKITGGLIFMAEELSSEIPFNEERELNEG